jgi:hypothetical protein
MSDTNKNPAKDEILEGTRTMISIAVGIAMIVISIAIVNSLYLGRTPIAEWFRWLVVTAVVWRGVMGNVGFSFGLLVAILLIRSLIEPFDASLGSCWAVSIQGLAWLMWVARYDVLQSNAIDWLVQLSRSQPPGAPSKSEPGPRMRINQILSRMSSILAVATIPVLGSMVLFNQPWVLNTMPWMEWTLTYGQVLWPGPILTTILIGTLVVMNELIWRQKTPQQMQLYGRSNAIRTMKPDLNRIIARSRQKR